jgi:DNA-directed RNA polymerase sigma subunit (sigma70/sigma32)
MEETRREKYRWAREAQEEGGPIGLMKAIHGVPDGLFEYVLDYDREDVSAVLDQVLNTITESESLVIKGRFGLNPGDSTPKTLEQVSRSLRDGTPFGKSGVTRERIRQIEAKALWKLRHPTRRLKLDACLVLKKEEEA